MMDVVLPDDIADLTKADLQALDITATMLDNAITTCQRYVREELPGSPERLVWVKRVGVLIIARRLFDQAEP